MSKRKIRSTARHEDVASNIDVPREASSPDLHHSVLGGPKDPTGNSRVESESKDGVTRFSVPLNGKSIICERRATSAAAPMIFTHGAGGGIANPATADFASGYASVAGSEVVCYQGALNLTNRVKGFAEVVRTCSNEERGDVSVIGGRSMGARAAVLTALDDRPNGAEESDDIKFQTEPCGKIKALLLVSYPLLAGSKGEKREPERREKVLKDLPEGIDVLFIIGSEDAQCDFEVLNSIREEMKARSWLVTVQGADHGMALKKKLGNGTRVTRLTTGQVAAEWVKERDVNRTSGVIRWDEDEEKVVFDGWTTIAVDEEPRTKKAKT